MSVSFSLSKQLEDLNRRFDGCKTIFDFYKVKEDVDRFALGFSENTNLLPDTDLFKYLNLSDKIISVERNFFGEQKKPFNPDPMVVFHVPRYSAQDNIRVLATFETLEGWEEKSSIHSMGRKNSSSEEKEIEDIPCYFARISDIWKRIPKSMQDKIDEQIYVSWSKESDDNISTDGEKGRHLREEKGFNDPLIRGSLEIFCLKNGIPLKKAAETKECRANADIDKLAAHLECPIDAAAVTDLSVYVPCGHSVSAKNAKKVNTCPTCRHAYTQIIPNYAARGLATVLLAKKE